MNQKSKDRFGKNYSILDSADVELPDGTFERIMGEEEVSEEKDPKPPTLLSPSKGVVIDYSTAQRFAITSKPKRLKFWLIDRLWRMVMRNK